MLMVYPKTFAIRTNLAILGAVTKLVVISVTHQKKNGGLMSKSTGDISQLTSKETKTTTKTKSTSKMNKLQTQQDLVKLTDKVDCLVRYK